MNAFDAHCTWEAVDGKNLSKTITWLDRKESSDIEDIIQAENCLLLEASRDEPDCKLRLSSAAPYCIRGVAVLCEARLVEVFGNHREYLETVRGGIVDEMDDMIVYRSDIPFDSPVGECTIKFAALKNKSKMWLYGVVVKVATVGLPVGRTRPNQNERLHPSYALAAQLLQMVSASPAPPPPDNKVDRGSQTEDVRHEKDTQTVAEQEQVVNPTVEEPPTARGEALPTPEALERLSESVSASVECCLEQMEQRLWAKMQQRIQEMERRITDHIQEIVDALKEEEEEEEEEEEGSGGEEAAL